MIVAMFFAGIVLGALFAHQSEVMQTASNDAPGAISLPYGAPVGRAMHYYR